MHDAAGLQHAFSVRHFHVVMMNRDRAYARATARPMQLDVLGEAIGAFLNGMMTFLCGNALMLPAGAKPAWPASNEFGESINGLLVLPNDD